MIGLYPVIAAANYKDEPQLIINYAQFHKAPVPSPTPTPTPTQKPVIKQAKNKPIGTPNKSADRGRNYGQGEVQDLIRKYSQQYSISPETPLCIAKKESGFNSSSRNPKSTASGVFQYIAGTWKATDEGKAGLSVFNADANIKAAIKYMSSRKNAKPWTVHTKCPPVTPIK
ncbi:MAG TPA: transglycosylase SLT domain-containing protein [Pyrinomonadaceae bacterium]